jgi:aryl-alcohol dehydrogenase-like predicted oxidoreductase
MLPTRTLGTQGLTVSSLGLGLMGMTQSYGTPEERDERESIATIHRAIELGVTFLDTAEAYGPYKNEELLARALEALGGNARDRVIIATKFGFKFDGNGVMTGVDSRPEHIREVVEGSLRRLQTVPRIVLTTLRPAPAATSDPTSEMPEIAFVADMSGVCNSGGTRAMTRIPTKPARTNTYTCMSVVKFTARSPRREPAPRRAHRSPSRPAFRALPPSGPSPPSRGSCRRD